jgi:hypothetical protein
MAWTAPATAVANATLPAATWNATVRDNLNATAVALASAASQYFVATGVNALAARSIQTATVATSQSSGTTTYGNNLATVGPQVTVTTGTIAVVLFTAAVSNTNANSATDTSVAVSGATSVAASDAWRTVLDGVSANQVNRVAGFHVFTGLTAGSNIFTVQYKVGSGTGTWADREICVFPF